MENKNFTTTILVEKKATEVFNAINNPRKWWSEEITGSTDKAGGIFDYHFEDIHTCKIKVQELVPGKKVDGSSSRIISILRKTKQSG